MLINTKNSCPGATLRAKITFQIIQKLQINNVNLPNKTNTKTNESPFSLLIKLNSKNSKYKY